MKDTFLNISKEKQQLIIHKAMKEFEEFGYEGASTNRLVKTLGISKGSLFKYFETKLDLYTYLIDYTIELLKLHMNTLELSTTAPKVKLIEYCIHEFDFIASNPNVGGFLYRMQRDMNLPSQQNLKDYISSKSDSINKDIFITLGIDDNPLLCQHLAIVITGYNRIFFESIDKNVDISSLKDEYSDNLKKHLDLIVWS